VFIIIVSQIPTSVQQTEEVVALTPTAITLWAASLVTVDQDTLEMDAPADVNETSSNFVLACHA